MTESSEAPLNPEVARLNAKLEAITADPEIAEALQSKTPGALKAAIERRLENTFDSEERRLLEDMRDDRRLTAVPIGRAPSLFTINGIGSMLYGRSEFEPRDGTYIATLFITFVFVPIFPRARYLVRDGKPSGWEFLGKMPASGFTKIWRMAFVLLIAGLAGVGALMTYEAGRTTEVYFFNGFDVPVNVQVDEFPAVTVPANAHVIGHFDVGPHRLRATLADGAVIDEMSVDFPAWHDFVAYNILGAAPVKRSTEVYSANSTNASSNATPKPEFYCGASKKFFAIESVDYVMKDAPETLKMSKSQTTATRTTVNVAPGGSWSVALGVELNRDPKEAAEFAESLALAIPSDKLEKVAGELLLRYVGTERALAFTKKIRDRRPDNLFGHRMYQELMERTGHRADALAEYQKRFEEHPDSADAAYLAVRLMASAESVERYAELAGRFPDHAMIRRAFGFSLFSRNRYAEAVTQFETYRTLDPDEFHEIAELYVKALVGANQPEKAIAELTAKVDADAVAFRVSQEAATMYARIWHLLPAQSRSGSALYAFEKLWGEMQPPPEAKYLFEVRTGLVQHEPPAQLTLSDELKAPTDIIRTTWRGQRQQALTAIDAADEKTLDFVPVELLLYLACEAKAAGRDKLAERLANGVGANSAVPTDLIRAFVFDRAHPIELDDIDLELRAVVHFVEARLPAGDLDADAAKQLEEKALADDVLGGFVTHAISKWPH